MSHALGETTLPDRRKHRGAHPVDGELFAPAHHQALRAAVADLAWLLGRGYVTPSALKLVGDRHQLRERQRMAVLRSTCSDAAREARASREVAPDQLAGAHVLIDGYNVLITVEAALAGGVLILGRDGCLRDLASLHGHFKRVEETRPAIERIGGALAAWGTARVTVLLDSPVSNSGRLAGTLREIAEERGWPWAVELVPNPDAELVRREGVVATSDSVVLDGCGPWVNLARHVVAQDVPGTGWIALDGR